MNCFPTRYCATMMLAICCASVSHARTPPAAANPTGSPIVAEIDRIGSESATEIAFTVDSEGRAAACTVERSSGSETLDREACNILVARGKFAARQISKEPKRYRTRIVWRIEE